jgi:hypothetical protein
VQALDLGLYNVRSRSLPWSLLGYYRCPHCQYLYVWPFENV